MLIVCQGDIFNFNNIVCVERKGNKLVFHFVNGKIEVDYPSDEAAEKAKRKIFTHFIDGEKAVVI